MVMMVEVGTSGHVDLRGRRGEEIGCPRSVARCRVHNVLTSPEGDRILLFLQGEGVRRLVDAETGEVIADDVVAADW